MILERAILDAVRELPADKTRDLLDHAKRLRDEATQPQKPRKNGRGLWADLNIDLSAESEPGVRAALGHWLFGYVHLYPDGNGRMSRLMIGLAHSSIGSSSSPQ
jgi:hypothetical protein